MKTRSRLLTLGCTVALTGATLVNAAPAMADPFSGIAAQQAIAKINSTACPTGADRDKALRAAHSYKVYSYGAAKAVAAQKAQQRFSGFTPGDLDRVATAGANAAQRCNLIVSPGSDAPAPAAPNRPAPAPAVPNRPAPAAPAPAPASQAPAGAPVAPQQLLMWAQVGQWDRVFAAIAAAVQQFVASLNLPTLPQLPQLPPMSS